MTDKNGTETTKSPNELLDEEVIRATQRKYFRYIDGDGKERQIMIGPIPESILTEGSEILTGIVSVFMNEYLRASIVVKNASKAGDEEISELEVFNAESVIKSAAKIPAVLAYFITNGTNIAYDEVRGDIGLCIELVCRILSHNIGERLQYFLSPSGRKLNRFLPQPEANSESKQNSSDGDSAVEK